MIALLASVVLAAPCPAEPSLRDPDGEVTVLAQNLKFIITGTRRKARDELLAGYLREEGDNVDILLLSEARITRSFEGWRPEWCFYTQVAVPGHDGYRWAPIESGRPPGGLAMGVRQRPDGTARKVSADAGRRYRARPTSFAEGVLGRVFGFRKGWAGLEIDDTHLVWSHTQASYKRRPERGAGEGRSGRVGQFADLADDLGRPERATLITGDLNLLAGFQPRRQEDEPRVTRARAIDDDTVVRFRERTGIDLAWPWSRSGAPLGDGETLLAQVVATDAAAPLGATADHLAPAEPLPVVAAVLATEAPVAATWPGDRGAVERPSGTFAGGIDRRREDDTWDVGAAYDRVGVNGAFLARHPGTRVRRVEIARGWMRVSDHFGLEIAIPFAAEKPAPPVRALAQGLATRSACRFSAPTGPGRVRLVAGRGTGGSGRFDPR
ncbi:MAG: hypothetical protein Q8P41_05480 [Pseudomonadota bacterium]|nr:hypothetical protein [Pseudomonadota bacterium]